MVSNQQFRLKWNNHRNTVLQEFETLLHNNSFVDCTIGADGKYLKAHKIVLSACSPYLQNVFNEHFDKHPVILLKDVSFKELKCMIDYMYCGEVNISECELPSFLRTAQSLKIKGLAEDINDYDSGSENEHPEPNSFLAENKRCVEMKMEIRDDEPPTKKTAPSLISANANNSLAVRKRKTPNSVPITGKPNTSSQSKPLASSNISNSCKPTETNSSNNASGSENERITNTSMAEDCVNDVDLSGSVLKDGGPSDPLEPRSKDVKEEPVDTDADEDNSSYEYNMNNPCDDSDQMNEDSESNCTNSGNKFADVSLRNVSSFNENDANGSSKRLSSQNARKLLSMWCEGLAGKPSKKEKTPVISPSSNKSTPPSQKLDVHCPNCGKYYKWNSSLQKHLRLECGQEPRCFCQYCKYCTHYPQDFKKHMVRVHKIRCEIKDGATVELFHDIPLADNMLT